ncbi:MAG: trypsin-like peptidase domain-containing protein [Bacteroidales bacterium]
MDIFYDNFRNAIVQIATPWASGTGFYIFEKNLIVTNRHVIEGAMEIVLCGNNFPKSIARLVYSDSIFDLAFIEPPAGINFSRIKLGNSDLINEGDQIVAIGHPYGLKFTATQGIISKAHRNWEGRDYIQIDAAINPGNSGGPLIDINHNIIGVNTFILADGVNLGFALPVNTLQNVLNEYEPFKDNFALRCASCSNITTKEKVKNYYCPNCGDKIQKEEFEGRKLIPSDAGEKIEEIISKLNYDVRFTRAGYNIWEIEEGSAIIRVNYSEEDNYVVAHAILCQLPKQNIGHIYEYLLKENNYIKGLSFSVIQQEIVLSMMHIHEDDLHVETGVQLLKSLIRKADDYDDILIDMGALPVNHQE